MKKENIYTEILTELYKIQSSDITEELKFEILASLIQKVEVLELKMDDGEALSKQITNTKNVAEIANLIFKILFEYFKGP